MEPLRAAALAHLWRYSGPQAAERFYEDFGHHQGRRPSEPRHSPSPTLLPPPVRLEDGPQSDSVLALREKEPHGQQRFVVRGLESSSEEGRADGSTSLRRAVCPFWHKGDGKSGVHPGGPP